MTDPTVPSRLPAGATGEGDGIMIGHGPVRVDAFIDFLCPFCRRFDLSSGPELGRLVDEGQISLVYHPMNFLDEASTTNYSTRAAAASGCAADGRRFIEYAHALFASQPPEGGPGLTDAQLAGIGRAVGLADAAFTACVSDARYRDWPPYVTARAVALGVEATPTVLVAGTAVRPEARSIAAAVADASGRGGLPDSRMLHGSDVSVLTWLSRQSGRTGTAADPTPAPGNGPPPYQLPSDEVAGPLTSSCGLAGPATPGTCKQMRWVAHSAR
jgi:protein-disulfide isomerase